MTGIDYTGNFTDQSEISALLSKASATQTLYENLGSKCQSHSSGKYLKYIGTAAAVRDMVSIANAIDGPDVPINYFGISYGSLIGSWFVNSE